VHLGALEERRDLKLFHSNPIQGTRAGGR
jgi:hypothetical protein